MMLLLRVNVVCRTLDLEVLRGIATNNKLAAQEFNYHAVSNCDPCAYTFMLHVNFM